MGPPWTQVVSSTSTVSASVYPVTGSSSFVGNRDTQPPRSPRPPLPVRPGSSGSQIPQGTGTDGTDEGCPPRVTQDPNTVPAPRDMVRPVDRGHTPSFTPTVTSVTHRVTDLFTTVPSVICLVVKGLRPADTTKSLRRSTRTPPQVFPEVIGKKRPDGPGGLARERRFGGIG